MSELCHKLKGLKLETDQILEGVQGLIYRGRKIEQSLKWQQECEQKAAALMEDDGGSVDFETRKKAKERHVRSKQLAEEAVKDACDAETRVSLKVLARLALERGI